MDTENLGHRLINGFEATARKYSGRFKYEACLGFTYSSINSYVNECLYFILEVQENEEEEIDDIQAALGNFEIDDMGTDWIIYFPNIPWVESFSDRE